MATRILIIEDEPELADLIALYCRREGWEAVVCGSAEEGLGALKAGSFDLITLDINLPGMDGFAFVERLRQQDGIPVMMVSARETEEDVVSGLGLGADEYVTKPFTPRVLMARIQAMLRRGQARESARRICFGDCVFEPDYGVLTRQGERVSLAARELAILELLLSQPGQAFTAHAILESVWRDQAAEPSAVGVYIQRLRRKLEADPNHPSLIETLHGRGYRFNAGALR